MAVMFYCRKSNVERGVRRQASGCPGFVVVTGRRTPSSFLSVLGSRRVRTVNVSHPQAPCQLRRWTDMAHSRLLRVGLHKAFTCSGSNKTEDKEKQTAGWAGGCFVSLGLFCGGRLLIVVVCRQAAGNKNV